MFTGQPGMNAALKPLQWPYGTTMKDRREAFEQEITTQHSPMSRPYFNTLNPVNVHTNPTSMLQIDSEGFGMVHNLSPISPLCYPRPILGCKGWNLPSENSSLHHPGSPINSSSSSEGSTFSSLDISDLISSLSLSPPHRLILSPTEQEMENLRSLHSLSSSPVFSTIPPTTTPSPCLPLDINRPWPYSDNAETFNRAVKLNRNHSSVRGTASWSGELPRHFALCPTYSCKVFLGGVPWDVTEETLIILFMNIGRIRVEWPGKENSESQPKGYVYVVFETESQVRALLNSCTREFSGETNENYYLKIYSKKLKYKSVQVIPWRLMDSNYVVTQSEKLDPHATVFVGGLHGMVSAEGLHKIMDDLFGGVTYVGIDTDKFKYPIGSARVTFNNRSSYIKAVMAGFVEIKTSRFNKKVQVDPYLEDAVCSNCVIQTGPYFCRELSCFRYYCARCWIEKHQTGHMSGHLPMVRTSKYSSNTSSPRTRFFPQ